MDTMEANLPGVLRLVAGEGVVYAPGLRAGCGLSSSFMPAHGTRQTRGDTLYRTTHGPAHNGEFHARYRARRALQSFVKCHPVESEQGLRH